MSCYCQVEVTKVENVLEITSPGPQGIPGGDAPDVQIEYSADNLTWAETYTEGDYYARFSTDGGDTWGTGVMFRGPQGEQGVQGDIGPEGPEVLFQYSADGVDWHSTYMAGDDYFSVSTNEGVTWGEAVYFRGEQGVQGEIGPAGPTGETGPAGPTGATGATGAQGPQGIQGPEGPQGPQGPAGADGIDGLDGADGRTILSGTGDPTNEGEDGDFYINTTSWQIFGPKATTWPAGVDIVGADGADGVDGTDGTDGTNGQGVPTGGTTGQVLAKSSATDYDTEWVDASSGGGGVSLGLVIALS